MSETCAHPASLIYFDKVYDVAQSWEVCDVCGVRFNEQNLQQAGTVVDDPGRLQENLYHV